MSGIFISYRRQDSAAHAGRLYDRLAAHFGAERVFMDVDDLSPGEDFAAQIESRVASCDAMVVVIGRNWLTARNDEGKLRLSDPNDFVGLEVAAALRRRVLVIPVLVGGAAMPKPENFRADLKSLAGRNALHIEDRDFQRDTDGLIAALEKRLEASTPAAKAAREADRLALRNRLLRRLIWKVPIILLLVSFAVWWEWRKQPETGLRSAGSATRIAGSWTGEVVYGWGAKYNEAFFFQPEGARLFGTASFLGTKRGIEEGKLEGDAMAFYVRYQEVSGTEQRERKNYYWGKLAGATIIIRMQDDRGSPPVEWALVRAGTSR